MSSIIKVVVLGIVVITTFVIMHHYKDSSTTSAQTADDDFKISGFGVSSFFKRFIPGGKPMCCYHWVHPRNDAAFMDWCYDSHCLNVNNNCKDDLSLCNHKKTCSLFTKKHVEYDN